MSCWENIYIQTFHNHGLLVKEPQVNDINPFYNIINETRIIPRPTDADTENQHKEYK